MLSSPKIDRPLGQVTQTAANDLRGIQSFQSLSPSDMDLFSGVTTVNINLTVTIFCNFMRKQCQKILLDKD